MTVFVCGSLHLDVIVDAPHLPRLDETVTGTTVAYAFGGKGGNQAVAAARMGAPTAMAGRVGDDAFAIRLRATLTEAGVDQTQVRTTFGPSGMSVAIIEPSASYGAVIVSAANLLIDPDEVTIPHGTTIVILQNEIPEPVNLAVATRARTSGAKVLLNAAPARAMSPALLAQTDILIVNRVEAADLLGIPDTALDPIPAAAALTNLGPARVILTLGGGGLVLHDGTTTHQPAHQVTAISTHGAGDAFIGALAAQLATGATLPTACAFAQAAAALHVSTVVTERARITPAKVQAFLPS